MSALLRSALIDMDFSLNLRPAKASLIIPKAAEPGCRPGRSRRCSPRASNDRGSRAYTDFALRRHTFLGAPAAPGSSGPSCRARRERLPSRRNPPPRPMPTSPDDLLDYLASLSIAAETVDHPALHTIEDSQALRGDIPGGHTKNLFVKDRRNRLFLLVLGETTVVDLKRVHEKIGAQGRVSFGSAELLEQVWGVRPGAITPFGAINDQAGKVRVVLDETMMRHQRLNFHPLVNTRTTGLASADLVKFLRATGHEPLVVALGQESAAG